MSLFMAIALALPAGALAVDRQSQTVTFNGLVDHVQLPAMRYGDPDFTVSATSDSGGTITFTITGGNCTVTGATVHITGAGSCAIEASVEGTLWYEPGSGRTSFTIYPAFQTITFPSPGSTLAIGVTIHMSATSMDLSQNPTGLAVDFESQTPGICNAYTNNYGGWLQGVNVGTCTVRAVQDNDDNWYSAYADQQIQIVRAAQTISFPPIGNRLPGDSFSLFEYVWSSSGMEVTLTSSAGCDVSGFQVHIGPNVGSCTITAHQGGNSQYAPADAVPQTFWIGELGDRIAAAATSQVRNPPLDRYGADRSGYDWSTGPGDWCADFAHWAWTQSGAYIPGDFESGPDHWVDPAGRNHTWAEWFRDYGRAYNRLSNTPAIGDVVWFGASGSIAQHVAIVTNVYGNGNIDIVGGNQAGGFVTQATNVSPAIGTKPAGIWLPIGGYVIPMQVGTTSSADATYSMQTGQIATGDFAVTANAGSSQNLDIVVGPFFSQVDLQLHRPNGSLVSPTDPGVTFTRLANSIEVSIAAADPGVWQYQINAIKLESGGEDIHIWATTTPIITTTVFQDSGESQYLQAATFIASLSSADGVSIPTGSVQFNLDGNPVGAPVALDATGRATWTTSALAVGEHTVRVDYLGSSQLVAPSSAPITHVVTRADQTITFGPLDAKTYGDADFAVGAAASSGLAVSFAADGNCAVGGTTVHISGAGSCTITASQAGDVNYNPAPDVAQSFDIAKADQTITFGALDGKTYGDADFTLSPTASSGLSVTLAAAGDCTVSGTTVHITAAGSCTITASQAGDANYNPASDVTRSFSIAKKPMTITANDATKLYGHTLTFAGTEFTLVGLVPGDSVTSVTLVSAGQWVGAQPGSHDIVPSAALGYRLSNYVISYANGTLKVNLVAIVGLDSVSITGSEVFDAVPNGGVFVVSNGSITVTGSAVIRGDVRSTQGSVGLTGSTVVTGDVSAGTTIASVSRIRGLASPNSPVPALIAPAVAACSPYSSAAGLSGSYSYDPATGNLSVSGSKTLTIASGSYCFGSIALSGSAKLVVSGPVTLRLTGKFSVSGSAAINSTGSATSLQISTSYAGSNGVVISGSPVAHLTMYAPAAQVVISGSAEIAGLVLGKSVSVSGSAAIHQDSSAVTVWARFYRN